MFCSLNSGRRTALTGLAAEIHPTRVAYRPSMKFIMAGWVEVGFEASIHMNSVEMASSLTRNFSVNDFRWRHVELVCWEHLAQFGNVLRSEEDNEIHVVREPGFAVEDCGHAPADQIPHSDLIQRPNEQQRELRFGHAETAVSLLARLVVRSIRGAVHEATLL